MGAFEDVMWFGGGGLDDSKFRKEPRAHESQVELSTDEHLAFFPYIVCIEQPRLTNEQETRKRDARHSMLVEIVTLTKVNARLRSGNTHQSKHVQAWKDARMRRRYMEVSYMDTYMSQFKAQFPPGLLEETLPCLPSISQPPLRIRLPSLHHSAL